MDRLEHRAVPQAADRRGRRRGRRARRGPPRYAPQSSSRAGSGRSSGTAKSSSLAPERIGMRVYNTLSRTKEEFVPREAGKVAMYVCGPTVYNHIHIGNARTFLSFDVIRRYLEYKGYDVRFIQNITDVDDKIINRANEEGRPAGRGRRRSTPRRSSRRCARSTSRTRPSDPWPPRRFPCMIAMIERLIERGHAYAVGGDVYFSVRSFPEYGKLSGRDIDEMHTVARVDADERKRDPLDFALWKAAKPGEPHWPSPWGEGRPGLAHRVFGDVRGRAGPPVRHPRRRKRPDLPAPRERDRPVRGRHRACRSRSTGCTAACSRSTPRR